jgi:hypothetical protein
MIRIRNTLKLLFCVGLLSLAFNSQAAFITTDSIVNSTVIDFSGQATVSNSVGPIQIGTGVGSDVTVHGAPNYGLYTNYNGWGLSNNGTWGSGMTYVSANNATPGDLIFTFNDGPVAAVGAFMNHCPNCSSGVDLVIAAFDAGNNLLESYNVSALADIVTPGGLNAGGFRGITRNAADITTFVVTGYVQTVDDLTFAASVPVPGTLGIFLVSLLLGAGLRR